MLCKRCENLHGWSTNRGFQQMQTGTDDSQLLITTMWKTERTSHDIWCNQDARRLKQLCIRLKCFDVDAHRWYPNCLYCACYVTHGHMTNGSARGQKNGIHSVILEHLRPLRRTFLHQAR